MRAVCGRVGGCDCKDDGADDDVCEVKEESGERLPIRCDGCRLSRSSSSSSSTRARLLLLRSDAGRDGKILGLGVGSDDGA